MDNGNTVLDILLAVAHKIRNTGASLWIRNLMLRLGRARKLCEQFCEMAYRVLGPESVWRFNQPCLETSFRPKSMPRILTKSIRHIAIWVPDLHFYLAEGEAKAGLIAAGKGNLVQWLKNSDAQKFTSNEIDLME